MKYSVYKNIPQKVNLMDNISKIKAILKYNNITIETTLDDIFEDIITVSGPKHTVLINTQLSGYFILNNKKFHFTSKVNEIERLESESNDVIHLEMLTSEIHTSDLFEQYAKVQKSINNFMEKAKGY